jgi:hypothetical protein
MPTCKECKHFNVKDDCFGECFGRPTPYDMDVEDCPETAFVPKRIVP